MQSPSERSATLLAVYSREVEDSRRDPRPYEPRGGVAKVAPKPARQGSRGGRPRLVGHTAIVWSRLRASHQLLSRSRVVQVRLDRDRQEYVRTVLAYMRKH